MLVTYEFYTNTYNGSSVLENDFPRYEKLAELFLNKITFGHIVVNDGAYGQIIRGMFTPLTEAELEALQYGVCNCLETIQRLSKAEDDAVSGSSSASNVKSRTSGGESISYESKKTVYDEALASEDKKTDLLKNALLVYAYPDVFLQNSGVNPYFAGRW